MNDCLAWGIVLAGSLWSAALAFTVKALGNGPEASDD